jgi:outer membrane protein assembly factor BamB
VTVLFSRESPVRGKLRLAAGQLIANLDRRPLAHPSVHVDDGGIGAFDPLTGEPLWSIWGVPPLAAADCDQVYAYGRAGVIVALDYTGGERWRTSLADDRSPSAQARGDREAPFVADVLVRDGEIVLAAGADLFRLATADGRIVGQTTVCAGGHAVVARLGGGADATIVATCTTRSAWDDERYRLEPKLWQVQASLESLRLTPGDVVAFESDLRERWRRTPSGDGLLSGDRVPLVRQGVVVLAAAQTARDGASKYVSLGNDRLLAIDEQAGQIIWQHDMPGGRGYVDPVGIGDFVVAGFEPALYALADGSVRWHLRLNRPRLDVQVAPLVDNARLLYAAENAIVGVNVARGTAHVAANLAELPAAAHFTTHLARGPFGVYFGLADPERPPMLWGMFLEDPAEVAAEPRQARRQ